MRILHLFSNTKLTGPAEPAINLCASLKKIGYRVMFACCTSSKTGSKSVLATAAERGLEPITRFRLNKHLNIKDNMYDLRRMPSFLKEARTTIVHAHMDNDHLVGGRSARKAGQKTVVVRSSYSGEGMKPSFRTRYLLRKLTDGLLVASESAKLSIIEQFNFPEERIWVVGGAVDTDRFNGADGSPSVRSRFGLCEEDFVFGVVARIQPHRRFNVILEAISRVSGRDPAVRLLIAGRGTHMREVAVEPVRRMRLENFVKFAGYQVGQDYVDTLACLDALIYLMPGTDGTCRAVREAMAMGKPIIAARRGMLPEIVDHGRNGLIIEDSPDALAEAIRYLVRNRDVARSMSAQSFKKASEKFRLDRQAREVARIYEEVLKMGRMTG
ncbi:glycosyltransferase family 4 protein [Candidatus Poribacteria bacterium]|nr:glycosyltransferase family 4 protein [Candidatus Poribacteria bacterium]